MIDRRSLIGLAAAAALARPSLATAPRARDPQNPDLRFGAAGYIWQSEVDRAIADLKRFGLDGYEPYRQHILAYANDPLALKRKLDAAGLTLITCSNGGPGQSTNFLDPAQTPKTIADHVAFAHGFLKPSGAKVWKINMGARPADGPSAAQLRTLAETLNAIGRETLAMGIRLAPHPHIWGPLEREADLRTVMAQTDPRAVWLTTDTAHLTLGGMDAAAIISDYFPRVAHVHLKDCLARYRGNISTPTQTQHAEKSLYTNLGSGGGVDFPAVFAVLRKRRYRGWAALDLDPPRPGDGTGDIADNLAVNIRYLRDVLGIRLPAPA